MNKLATFIGFLVILLIGFLVWRNFNPKEAGLWVCQNGQWVKQGEPLAVKPPWDCKEGEKVGDNQEGQGETVDQAKFARSQQMAEEAVKNSPTYKLDGYDLKFQSSGKLDCSSCFEFVFSYSSRHAGYGSRSGKFLAQLITPHEARVIVEDEKVTMVVNDQTFDELKQIYLK